MGDNSIDGDRTDGRRARDPSTRAAPKSGWWWKFTALFMGVPPLAVYGAEEEVEQERSAPKGSAKD